MMHRTSFTKAFVVFGSLLIFSILAISGCKQARNPQPLTGSSHAQTPDVSLKLFQGEASGMKVTGITITAQAVDGQGNPEGEPGASVTIPDPVFPLDVPVEVYVPPCNYRISVVASSDQGLARTGTATANACEDAHVYMTIDSFSDDDIVPDGCPPGEQCEPSSPSPSPSPASSPSPAPSPSPASSPSPAPSPSPSPSPEPSPSPAPSSSPSPP